MSVLDEHKLMEHVRQFVAIYPDEPEITKEVRFDSGAIFAEGASPALTFRRCLVDAGESFGKWDL